MDYFEAKIETLLISPYVFCDEIYTNTHLKRHLTRFGRYIIHVHYKIIF